MRGITAGRKVVIYITRPGSSDFEVLVFEHVGIPEAGLQVPAGHAEAGETPVEAARRELHEEAGLDAGPFRPLGERRYRFTSLGGAFIAACDSGASDRRQPDHPAAGEAGAIVEDWFFFVAQAAPGLPETWDHVVGGSGEDRGLVFRYRWVSVGDSPLLEPPEGDFLEHL